jgi:hypothetical protein
VSIKHPLLSPKARSQVSAAGYYLFHAGQAPGDDPEDEGIAEIGLDDIDMVLTAISSELNQFGYISGNEKLVNMKNLQWEIDRCAYAPGRLFQAKKMNPIFLRIEIVEKHKQLTLGAAVGVPNVIDYKKYIYHINLTPNIVKRLTVFPAIKPRSVKVRRYSLSFFLEFIMTLRPLLWQSLI